MLCLMGHIHRAAGDSTRAMESYVEALKLNPYLWEAFDGLVELGASLKVENCFKASSTMRALRDSTHATNIDSSSTQSRASGFSFSLVNIPEGSGSTPGAFQPVFNWTKSSAFSSNNQPVTPGYPEPLYPRVNLIELRQCMVQSRALMRTISSFLLHWSM